MKHRIILSSLLALGLLAGCASSEKQPLSIIELTSENDKILVNEESDIQIKTDPSGTELSDADFDADGGKIEVDQDTAHFSADKAGTYTIKADKDGVESNPVTITVVDDEDQKNSNSSGTADSLNTQSNTQNSQPSQNTGSSQSDQPAQPVASDSQPQYSEPPVMPDYGTDLSVIMENPDQYAGKTITVVGYDDGATPLSGDAQLPDGTYLFILWSADSKYCLPIDFSQMKNPDLGDDGKLSITGKLVKQKVGNYDYVLDATNVVLLGNNGVLPGKAAQDVGDPVSDLLPSGTFQFSVNNVNIRRGEDGLEGQKTGEVYNVGMKVNYDKVYQKDGYTWISYIGASGERDSVAVGDLKTVLYGFNA